MSRSAYRAPRPAELDDAQQLLRAAVLGGPRAGQARLFRMEDDEGRLLGPFGLALLSPDVGMPMQELGAALRYSTVLTDRQREIAILTVAQMMSSSYETYAHEAIGRSVGLTEAELAALADGTFTGADRVEQVIHDATRLLLQCDAEPEALQALAEELEPRPMFELTLLVGYYRALATAMSAFGVVAPETR